MTDKRWDLDRPGESVWIETAGAAGVSVDLVRAPGGSVRAIVRLIEGPARVQRRYRRPEPEGVQP